MNPDSRPTHSPVRLHALHASGLLDGQTQPALDRLTRLTSVALRVPVALISLIDRDRQVFKSLHGLPEPWATQRQTPLSHSFCQHVVDSAAPLVIEDARLDARVCDNLAIRDLNVIAYAGVPVFDTDGFVLGSICAIDAQPRQWTDLDLELLHGLSAQITLELQLRQQAARADAEAKQLRQATRLNVHDLRTPLAAMIMGLQLIERLGPVNEPQRNYLGIVQQNGRTLQSMLDDLLDIGGLDHRGSASLRCEDCRAADAINAAVQQVSTLAIEGGLSLRTEVNDALTTIRVDVDKLTRVLVNLLGNAIKFTDRGGYVTISAKPDHDGGRAVVQFVVADTGIGIADAQHIFEEGVRLDPKATTRRSAGIGLTFCKRIVDAHGGRIWVESHPGLGSKFHFTIPTMTAND